MKDIREDWEIKFDKRFPMIDKKLPNGTGYYSYESADLKAFINALLTQQKQAWMEKIENKKRHCSAIENDESPEGCDCLIINNTLDDVLETLKKEEV